MSVAINPEELVLEGTLSFNRGDFEAGAVAYRQAATAYAEQGKHQLLGFTLATLGLRSEANRNLLDETLSAYEGASKAFRQAGQQRQSVDASFSAGLAAKAGGRNALAAELLSQVAEEYKLLANRYADIDAGRDVPSLQELAAEARKQADQCIQLVHAGAERAHAK